MRGKENAWSETDESPLVVSFLYFTFTSLLMVFLRKQGKVSRNENKAIHGS